ncbi:MAG: hypothetical protein HQ486_04425 [Acidimicrobiaceae bacterium]|nr:hypothetical protein [Acidimicrobiaceae bacterium]
MGPLTKEIPQINLREVRDILRLRWWIIPLCMIVAAGLMFSQESDLQTTPLSTTVYKTFGAKDEIASLAVFGVDPNSVKEFPTFQNQLSAVRLTAPKKVEEILGNTIGVAVSRTDPQVSMVNSAMGDGGQRFTVMSVGTPNYVFSCTAKHRQECDKAIDVFVSEIVTARKDGILEGLKNLSSSIKAVVGSDNVVVPDLGLKLAAIEAISPIVSGQLSLVDEEIAYSGGTVSTVKISTYVFGLASGLIIAIIIILQLTFTDDRIRSRRKIEALGAELSFLGEMRQDSLEADINQTAAALVTQARRSGTTKIVLVPVGKKLVPQNTVGPITDLAHSRSIQITSSADVDSLTLGGLVDNPSTAVVLVVFKHESSVDQLRHTYEVLNRTGHQILGITLSDSNL